ncbi:MAG TPA: hypothetical protein VLL47_05760 [Robiginitalea sp.]|nr:hypothetical protein [Robiginitalea sp.]
MDSLTLKRLTALKETLVVTTGDNYVGLAEPRLRENMSGLYSKVSDSYDAPSAADFEALKPREKAETP